MSEELRVQHLSKTFEGARLAVDDVSFVAEPGEIIVLLGPSGCGKTTTMRAVAGLEQPSAGEIRIGGRVVADASKGFFAKPQKRNVGMVFQSYAIWPHMTVASNVRYPLRYRGVSGREANQRVAHALEIVNLSQYADRPATALSGGQMQRVALARSLVYEPSILLLDEPLSNLDAKLRLRLREEVRRIIKSAGVTALYVTHDQSEAVAVADRIGVMRDGRLLQIATPSELYSEPANLFVAEFLGATNQASGSVQQSDGKRCLMSVEGIGDLNVTAVGPVEKADRAVIAVRPESLRLMLGRESPAEGWNRLSAIIKHVRFQGVQTSFTLAFGPHEWEAVEYGTRPACQPGDAITIGIPADACWAFAGGVHP